MNESYLAWFLYCVGFCMAWALVSIGAEHGTVKGNRFEKGIASLLWPVWGLALAAAIIYKHGAKRQ